MADWVTVTANIPVGTGHGGKMSEVKSFRDLRVWQRGVELVGTIYTLVRGLPDEERAILGDQLRRAATSIPANIAEGHTRLHRKEFQHFLSIAHGSLSELETHLCVATRISLMTQEQVAPALAACDELSRMLTVLRLRLDATRNEPKLSSASPRAPQAPRPSSLIPRAATRDPQ